jgi:hypothetical protein
VRRSLADTLPRWRGRDTGFYTKTGVGTQVVEGKIKFDGEDYILERGYG